MADVRSREHRGRLTPGQPGRWAGSGGGRWPGRRKNMETGARSDLGALRGIQRMAASLAGASENAPLADGKRKAGRPPLPFSCIRAGCLLIFSRYFLPLLAAACASWMRSLRRCPRRWRRRSSSFRRSTFLWAIVTLLGNRCCLCCINTAAAPVQRGRGALRPAPSGLVRPGPMPYGTPFPSQARLSP